MKRFKVQPGFVLMLSLLFYLSPLWLFWSFLFCTLIHELCHVAALKLWEIPIIGCRLGFNGAVLDTAPMSFRETLFCALAGPFGNLFLFWVLWKPLPRLATVSLVIGVYNLLPVYPLDGGRALRGLLGLFLPLSPARWVEWGITTATFLCLAIGIFRIGSPLGYGIGVLLLFRVVCLLPMVQFASIIKRKNT